MARSHTELAFGARKGVWMTSMPSAANTESKLAVNLVSLSRIRKRNPQNRPESSRARWPPSAPVSASGLSGALTRLDTFRPGGSALPLRAEAPDSEVDRALVVAGAVDVATKGSIERYEVGSRQTAGPGDELLTQERHVVHAPEDA